MLDKTLHRPIQHENFLHFHVIKCWLQICSETNFIKAIFFFFFGFLQCFTNFENAQTNLTFHQTWKNSGVG